MAIKRVEIHYFSGETDEYTFLEELNEGIAFDERAKCFQLFGHDDDGNSFSEFIGHDCFDKIRVTVLPDPDDLFEEQVEAEL